MLDGQVSEAFFAHSVAGAGDVNHDGYADVIAGAYATTADGGSIYVYCGSPHGCGHEWPGWPLGVGSAWRSFGQSVWVCDGRRWGCEW